MSPRGRFGALLVADIVSALGSRISLVAIPWLVLVTTGNVSDMGLIAAAEMLPYLLASMLLTPVADWLGLRLSSVLCDLASAIAMAGIAAFPGEGFGWLMLLVGTAGALRGVGDRTKHVLLRPAALQAGYPMIRVTSLYEGLTRLVTLLGSPLGGLLIVWFGAQRTIWVDAASFGFCAAVVSTLVAGAPAGTATAAGTHPADPAVPDVPDVPASRESYRAALTAGFRYLRSDRVLFGMLATVFALNLFANAATLVFIPIWAREVLHSPEALGLALGAFAGGALLGTLALTVAAQRLPQYPTFLLGALVSGAPRLFAVGLSSNLAVVLLVSVLAGFAIAAVNPILGVAMYERVPDALQTRVIGLCTTVSFTGVPIGALAAGWAVSAFGLHQSLLGAAVLCLAVNLVPLRGASQVSLTAPVASA